jgi:Na+/proline symporter
VKLIRLLVLIIGATAVTLACFVGGLGDVFAIGKKTTAAFGGPLLAVFVMALFFKRASASAVFIGALAAAGITLFLMYDHPDWFSVWYWPIGFGLAMMIAIVLSFFLKQPAGAALTFSRVMRESRAP